MHALVALLNALIVYSSYTLQVCGVLLMIAGAYRHQLPSIVHGVFAVWFAGWLRRLHKEWQ